MAQTAAEGNYGRAVQCYREDLAQVHHYRALRGAWVVGLAGLAADLHQHELAARLLGTIGAADEDIRHQYLYPDQRDDYNRLAEATRAHLGTQRFDATWAMGRATPFETVVEAAVSALEDVLRTQDQAPPG